MDIGWIKFMENYKKVWNIKSIKQNNGLYGIPLQVWSYKPAFLVLMDYDKHIIQSAVIMSIAEKYKNCYIKFDLFSNLTYFIV